MHFRQVLAIAVVVACVAIDGFDVFAIAFASPVIAQQWGVEAATLGVMLSMELVGMGAGAWLLGTIADLLGRRPAIVISLTIMATGMWLASAAAGVGVLCAARLYTGLGIGGLLAAGSAIVSESASDRRRDMAVALMVAGYPLGAAMGGVIASAILESTSRWQSIFEVGAAVTGALILPVIFCVPESIAFLCARRPKRALHAINRILSRYGKPPVASITLHASSVSDADVMGLHRRDLARSTIELTVAFFMHMMTFYFLMKWIPKLVVDMGHSAASGSVVLVWANLAGVVGSLVMSLLTQRYPVRSAVILAMACGSLSVILFGQGLESLSTLSVVAVCAGFFTTGASAGFYAILTRVFPPQIRARGTGFVIGIGRAGAAAGPVAAGLLFSAGWPLSVVAVVMACGCLIAAVAIGRLAAGKELLRRSPGWNEGTG